MTIFQPPLAPRAVNKHSISSRFPLSMAGRRAEGETSSLTPRNQHGFFHLPLQGSTRAPHAEIPTHQIPDVLLPCGVKPTPGTSQRQGHGPDSTLSITGLCKVRKEPVGVPELDLGGVDTGGCTCGSHLRSVPLLYVCYASLHS